MNELCARQLQGDVGVVVTVKCIGEATKAWTHTSPCCNQVSQTSLKARLWAWWIASKESKTESRAPRHIDGLLGLMSSFASMA